MSASEEDQSFIEIPSDLLNTEPARQHKPLQSGNEIDNISADTSFKQKEPDSMLAPTASYQPDGEEAMGTVQPSASLENANSLIIGPFRLVRCLGQGGMGAVWEAQQLQPVKRRVALKVIKGGLGSPEVITRFQAERQALALMEHPHIAKILDAGMTPSGQPYFAMELVDGLPLTNYCDSVTLSIEARLQLFHKICTAVHHAHQKGIIHRDLKPGNILVTSVDGHETPKIIDFGLAKATNADNRLTDESMHTFAGQLLGTLKYMSPEQASLSTADIDTRCDIYSLGVILCELMVGRTGLDENSLRSQPLLKTLDDIRSVQSLRPSVLLHKLPKEKWGAVAKKRAIDSARLLKKVSGDLDHIVMKATENEPSQRYQSAAEFAADINRYLNLEPVLAQPPTRFYLLRMFIRRNRVAVAVASVLLLSLLGGMVGTTWGLLEANRARIAESERADGERRANVEAQKRLQQVESSNAILNGIFKDLDIRQVRSGNQPLERVLADKLVEAGKLLNQAEIAEPLIVAEMKTQLCESLLNLGFPNQAIDLLAEAVVARTDQLGQYHTDTLTSRSVLGEALLELGSLDQAIAEFEEVLKYRKISLPPDHTDIQESMNNLAEAYRQAGRSTEAVQLLEKTVVLREAALGNEHLDTLVAVNNLAIALLNSGDVERSHEILEEAFQIAILSLGADHPVTLAIMNNRASALQRLGQDEEAIAVLEDARELIRGKMGEDHPDRIRLNNNIADFYRQAGKLEEAILLYEKNIPLLASILGTGHTDVLSASINYAEALGEAERFEIALDQYDQTLKKLSALGMDEHQYFQRALQGRAFTLWSNGQADEALNTYQQVLDLQKYLYGDAHPEALLTMLNVGIISRESGYHDRAVELLQHVTGHIDHYPELKLARNELKAAFLSAGRIDEYLAMMAEDLRELRNRLPPESLELAGELLWIGFRLNSVEQFERAEQVLRESYRIRLEQLGKDDWRTCNTQSVLGESLMGLVLKQRVPELVGQQSLELSQDEQAEVRRAAVSSFTPEQKELLRETRSMLEKGFLGLKAKQDDIPDYARQQRLTEAVVRVIEFYSLIGLTEKVRVWQEVKDNLQVDTQK